MGACRHTILLKFKTGSSIDIESNDLATVYTLKYERKYNLRIIHKEPKASMDDQCDFHK